LLFLVGLPVLVVHFSTVAVATAQVRGEVRVPPIDTAGRSITTARSIIITRDETRVGEQLERTMLSVDPFKFGVLSIPHLYVHRVIGRKFVLGGTLEYVNAFGRSSGYGLQAELRYSFSDRPLAGYFIQIGASYDHVSYAKRDLASDVDTSLDRYQDYQEDPFTISASFGGSGTFPKIGFTFQGIFGIAWNPNPTIMTIASALGFFHYSPYISFRGGWRF
jgi:hypothetical protein